MRSPSPSRATAVLSTQAPATVSPLGWAVALGAVALACAWVPFLLEAQGERWRVWGVGAASVIGAVAVWLASRQQRAPAGESYLGDVRLHELQEREERWNARMALSADWYWQTDHQMRITWVSEDLASVFKLGLMPENLLDRQFADVPELGAPEGGWERVHALSARRKDWREVIVPVLRAGRPPSWVALNARARIGVDGRFEGYDGVGRDVSEQTLANLRLADSDRRLALMAELSADWYWQTDDKHRLTEFGPVMRQLLADRADKALGRTHWQAFRYGASDEEWEAHKDDLQAHRPFRDFVFAIRSQGVRWVSMGGRPRFSARGEFLGYHGVGRDITLSKRAERMLVQRNRELQHLVNERTAALEQTNRDLEGFARHIAHELRTPIGHVAGLAELLAKRAKDRLTEQEREWLRLQQNAARDMSHTVTALLELARSTSSELLLEHVDLSLMARSVIAELAPIERVAPVEWAVQDGATARCSSTMARVVLTNLLANAAKFTRDQPAPRVAFGVEEDGMTFFVHDNGAGFDTAKADKLFQPFVRLHTSKQFPGTGLGLSIVRRIVERHGGHISAEGELGGGVRIEFTLAPPPPSKPEPETGAGALSDFDEFGDVVEVIEVRRENIEPETLRSLVGVLRMPTPSEPSEPKPHGEG
jgi:PAS domain S-box-containing protein